MLFVLLSLCHGGINLFSTFKFDCPSGIFRLAFKGIKIEEQEIESSRCNPSEALDPFTVFGLTFGLLVVLALQSLY